MSDVSLREQDIFLLYDDDVRLVLDRYA